MTSDADVFPLHPRVLQPLNRNLINIGITMECEHDGNITWLIIQQSTYMYFGQGSHSLGLQLWSLACHRIHLCHHLGQPMIANHCKCRSFHPILANQHLSSWSPTPSLLLPWPDWDESEGMEECDQRGDKTNKFLSL